MKLSKDNGCSVVFGSLLVVVIVLLPFYIIAFLVEFVKNCILAWPLEPINENDCLAETHQNASKQAKQKTDEVFSTLFLKESKKERDGEENNT